MRCNFSKPEIMVLAACLGLSGLALFGPAFGQPGSYHDFADQRMLWGLPFAMDVLSNLAFALAGLAGFGCLLAALPRRLTNVQRAMAAMFFAGLLLTAAASSWYHWQPDDAGLAIDRSGMAVAFAGLLGLAAAGRVSERAGAALGLGVLALSPPAVMAAVNAGNVLPWATLQFGGLALLLWFAQRSPRVVALDVRWGRVIALYALAKLFEIGDATIFEWTGHLVSGHTLKHVVAACAAWPVIAAIGALRNSGQNAPVVDRTKDVAARREGRASMSQERSPV